MGFLLEVLSSAAVSTILIVIGAWLARKLIQERLTASVRFEFEEKIEKIKSELKTREQEIEALRNFGISNVSYISRSAYKRRLSACDELWEAVIERAQGKNVASLMVRINYHNAAKQAPHDNNTRQFFETLEKTFSPKSNDRLRYPSKAKPFISKIAWSYFYAYDSIIFQSVARLKSLSSGVELNLINDEKIKNVVLAALPHYEKFITEHGDSALPLLLEEIEELLLQELKNIIAGNEEDQKDLCRAAKIIDATNKLKESGYDTINTNRQS